MCDKRLLMTMACTHAWQQAEAKSTLQYARDAMVFNSVYPTCCCTRAGDSSHVWQHALPFGVGTTLNFTKSPLCFNAHSSSMQKLGSNIHHQAHPHACNPDATHRTHQKSSPPAHRGANCTNDLRQEAPQLPLQRAYLRACHLRPCLRVLRRRGALAVHHTGSSAATGAAVLRREARVVSTGRHSSRLLHSSNVHTASTSAQGAAGARLCWRVHACAAARRACLAAMHRGPCRKSEAASRGPRHRAAPHAWVKTLGACLRKGVPTACGRIGPQRQAAWH